VFLDTNVLVSAFATRGLCADVFRHVVSEHSLVTGEVVLKELRRVLRTRIRLPVRTIDAVEEFLREHEVVAKPQSAPHIAIRDPDDKWVLASALSAKVDVLVTGDRDLLELEHTLPLRILDPRGFWELVRGRTP
jgi:putative PIN family toxin of toxin-antitoxin system